MSQKRAGSQGNSNKAVTIKDIQDLAIQRQEAWERARELSMELHEAIESSGLTPTEVAAAAPISRVGIYSLKRQMEARRRKQGGSRGK